MASGAIRTGDVETTSQALWAACHGLVALLITVPAHRFAFVPADRLISHTIDTHIAGLQASAAWSAPSSAPARPAADRVHQIETRRGCGQPSRRKAHAVHRAQAPLRNHRRSRASNTHVGRLTVLRQ